MPAGGSEVSTRIKTVREDPLLDDGEGFPIEPLRSCHRAVATLSPWFVDTKWIISAGTDRDGNWRPDEATLVAEVNGKIRFSFFPPTPDAEHFRWPERAWRINMTEMDTGIHEESRKASAASVDLMMAVTEVIDEFEPEPEDYGWS